MALDLLRLGGLSLEILARPAARAGAGAGHSWLVWVVLSSRRGLRVPVSLAEEPQEESRASLTLPYSGLRSQDETWF